MFRTQGRLVRRAWIRETSAASRSSPSVQKMKFRRASARGVSASATRRTTRGMTRLLRLALSSSSQAQISEVVGIGTDHEYDRIGGRDQSREPVLPRLARRDIGFVEESIEAARRETLDKHLREGGVLARVGDEYLGLIGSAPTRISQIGREQIAARWPCIRPSQGMPPKVS